MDEGPDTVRHRFEMALPQAEAFVRNSLRIWQIDESFPSEPSNIISSAEEATNYDIALKSYQTLTDSLYAEKAGLEHEISRMNKKMGAAGQYISLIERLAGFHYKETPIRIQVTIDGNEYLVEVFDDELTFIEMGYSEGFIERETNQQVEDTTKKTPI